MMLSLGDKMPWRRKTRDFCAPHSRPWWRRVDHNPISACDRTVAARSAAVRETSTPPNAIKTPKTPMSILDMIFKRLLLPRLVSITEIPSGGLSASTPLLLRDMC
jgi:hypothetical protein